MYKHAHTESLKMKEDRDKMNGIILKNCSVFWEKNAHN